ncbi:MAG TPA: NAD(P)/FAD-dependent oxidoreductase [Burkholderiales bacterium]|nr:NAD(P)/FAD-dependent oxidoreductase [Burkholderiales bacterium]
MSAGAVVIGDGVDELVAAHYLARAGHHVRVIGKSASAPDAFPLSGWVPPKIVRDLALDRHGLAVYRADPWAIAMLPEGRRLELSSDIARSADAIRALSARDAAKWPDFCQRMHALARLLESVYTEPPPDPLAHARSEFLELARLALRVRGLGSKGIEDLMRLMPMSVADMLDDWFESDTLKGVLGAAGVMHLCQGPRSGGTAFNFLHHHVGSPAGIFRPPITNIASVLRELPGVEIRAADVAQISVTNGEVAGVVLTTGEDIPAAVIVSGAHPKRTLLELIDPGWLDPQLVRAVQRIRSRGVATALTVVIDRVPDFTMLVIAPSLDYLERAYDDAKYGNISTAPFIEARHTGAAEDGRHRVTVHMQYAPHALKNAVWDTAQADRLGRAIVASMDEHVPSFADLVIERKVLTPYDLEHIHGFPEGQSYHAELALDQLLWMRPVPDLAHYRAPIRGLYLCGPAMHPGAGIAGAAGANAARVLLSDLKKTKNR